MNKQPPNQERLAFSLRLKQFLEAYGFKPGIQKIFNWEFKNNAVSGQFLANRQVFAFTIDEDGINYRINTITQNDSYLTGKFLASAKINPLLSIRKETSLDTYALSRLDAKRKGCSVGIPCGGTCIDKKNRCRIGSPEVRKLARNVIGIAAKISKASPSISPEQLKARVEEEEDKIKDLPYERLIIINPNTGETLRNIKGDKASVAIEEKDVHLLKDAIVTHNHPYQEGDNPESLGHSFSQTDVQTACVNKVREVRAVSAGYRHSLKPPKEGWNEGYYYKTLGPAYDRNFENEYNKAINAIRRGADPTELGNNFWHSVMEATAKECKLDYKREKIPGVDPKALARERLRKSSW